MVGRTHDLAAFTALNLVVIQSPLPGLSLATSVCALGACFVGGLAHDLDQPTGSLWEKIPAGTFFGRIFSNLFWKHRTISHSIIGLIIFGFLVRFIVTWIGTFMIVDTRIIWLAFMIGFLSHLIVDSLTHEGVPWLFPLAWYIGIPPFSFLRLKTGGNLERYIVFPGLLVFNGFLFWKNYELYLNLLHNLF